MKNLMTTLTAAAVASLALVGCGGGGGGGSDAPAVQPAAVPSGVYTGGLTNSTASGFQLMVLPSGEFYGLYGNTVADTFIVTGMVQGNGAVSGSNAFASSNIKDFGAAPATAGTMTSTFNASAHTISGSIAGAGTTVGFTGGPVTGSLYDFNAAPALATIAGNWTLTSTSGATIALTVSNTGAFGAVSDGCSISGTMAPHSSGKNVFSVSMTFGGAPCVLANQTAVGIALALPRVASMSLLVAVVDSSRTVGSASIGTRCEPHRVSRRPVGLSQTGVA